ncbi:50S ribosomal protein L11 methyltransferase [Nisaea acidiphila]|uniref:Ribosomal protein L11 methyltransferase n=1 Tax=Nisaea acidiphila TaxID=1862145 RepID=A0A9J7ARX1_9PROT|nr:50S ribosomal protein L11 methyltransferase [Nisaea acidiphila]UUX49076.1 50S ribosomal protein L11 methyltransferase [Nisaea acidiphila]
MKPIWQVSLETTAEAALPLSDVLEPFVEAISVFEEEDRGIWILKGVSTVEPDRAEIVAALSVAAAIEGMALPEIEVALLPDTDWVRLNRESFPAMQFGRFLVHGSHLRGKTPRAVLNIEVDAAQAFGSGSHGTTEGCLRAIGRLACGMRPAKVLDMGCGSGILSMAAARIWPAAGIMAVDIDPVSVATTRENAIANGVAARVRAEAGNGYAVLSRVSAGHYDLILSNILARPLCRMAPDLTRYLKPGGRAVLSGLLHHQTAAVVSAHRAQGLRLVRKWRYGDWMTLLLEKKTGAVW